MRLRIIDLGPEADQPFQSADGSVTLSYNGEIYNYLDLRAELAQLGFRFRTQSDTECIVALYQHHQGDMTAVLSRLRGMFALAIWDSREERLMLAVDRMGIKPLTWTTLPSGIAFASEAPALAAAGLARREASLDSVGAYLRWGSVPAPATIYKDIKRLCPGTMLQWDGTPKEQTWWRPPLEVKPVARSEGEAVALIRTALTDAVERQLIADRPIGLFLSSGTDSGSLAAVAAARHDLTAVSVSFPEHPELDESPGVRARSEQLGLDLRLVPTSASDVLSAMDSIISSMTQPSVDAANSWIVNRAAKEAGLTVVLSGVGGDELFGGYPSFRQIPRLLPIMKAAGLLPQAARASISGLVASRRPGSPIARALTAEATIVGAYGAVRTQFAANELPLPAPTTAPLVLPTDMSSAVSHLELQRYLANQLLMDSDGMAMSHSLELRVPLLDETLVASALSLPSDIRYSGKQILGMAAGLTQVPVKRTFTFPFEMWMRSSLSNYVRSALYSEDLPLAYELPTRWRSKLWRAFESGRLHWSRPWSIAALRLWLGIHELYDIPYHKRSR